MCVSFCFVFGFALFSFGSHVHVFSTFFFWGVPSLVPQGVLCFSSGRYMALCPSAMPDAHTRPRWVSLSGSDNAAADEAQDWSDLCWNVAPSRGYVPVAIFYEVRTVPNPSAGS